MDKLLFPNPIFIRESTQIINDSWQIDLCDGEGFKNINVPYCPESKRSGIEHTDFIYHCIYKKTLSVNKFEDKRIILHFGAVDYFSQLFINDKFVGFHVGGYTPFEFDITDFVENGENHLVLDVRDNFRDTPSGKQAIAKRESYGCNYTRTTGIWQSVWLEYVPFDRIESVRFYPDIHNGSVKVDLSVKGNACEYSIKVFYKDKEVGEAIGNAVDSLQAEIKLDEKHLWSVGDGQLYDVEITYGEDKVYTYFGLRETGFKGMDFYINDEIVFQKLVLDQGFYPEGIYTAEADEYKHDIDISMDLGFNGARLHQRTFDPRFLYLCDKAGYITWGEFASWGIDYTKMESIGAFISEWQTILKRDFNHPSIITWCPLNEVWANGATAANEPDIRYVETIYQFTKEYDITRPCVDTSGGWHGKSTDVCDTHCYGLPDNVAYLCQKFTDGINEFPVLYGNKTGYHYEEGIPVINSEFGGTAIHLDEGAWGYNRVPDGNALADRFVELAKPMIECKKLSGYCYTQLYDIEQEQNGFYTYDRRDKLTDEEKQKIRNINQTR